MFVGIPAFPGLSKKETSQISWNLFSVSQTPNHVPKVKFNQPVEGSIHEWNEVVPYSIEISDQEDGESKYQEIQSAEVLIKMKYIVNQPKLTAYVNQKTYPDSVGVNSMLISNCFNCHSVKMKMSGPSFSDISKRYQNTIKNQDLLISHIRQGSKGIWGTEVMPTHSELSDVVARQMVKWILNYAKEPDLNYLVGLQGSLPLNKPVSSAPPGLFVIEAFYTDHGTVDHPENRLKGSARIIIHMK